jgi:hypothetical protein
MPRKSMSFETSSFDVYFYFFIPPGKGRDASHANYKPQLLSLAEGLRSLGVPFSSNIDWWRYRNSKESEGEGEYLFKKTKRPFSDFTHVVVGSEIFNHPPLPSFIKPPRARKYKLVTYDWVASTFFTKYFQKKLPLFDTCFYYAYNNRLAECTKHVNVLPWPIGLTDRVIEYTKRYEKPFSEREIELLWSHRVGHTIRTEVKKKFYNSDSLASAIGAKLTEFNDKFSATPVTQLDKLYAEQTGRRHNPKFYETLGNSKMVDCCGGFFLSGGGIKNWDSYKLWESFAAGCCVITLDLDYYGFKLPVMPVNGVHYIGIRLDDPNSLNENIKDNDIEAIAKNGKKWALENYSPQASAKHFLENMP